jgi:hypothetical protein
MRADHVEQLRNRSNPTGRITQGAIVLIRARSRKSDWQRNGDSIPASQYRARCDRLRLGFRHSHPVSESWRGA